MKALLIKTSSLGDLIHTMPAISDAFACVRDLELDWVIEEDFAAVGHWHRDVGNIFPLAARRWRRQAAKGEIGAVFRNIAAFRRRLAETRYDIVLDAQGLYKSAVVTRMARGRRFGFSRGSLREPLAAMAYDETVEVPGEINIIERNRRLFAGAFGYELPPAPADFAIASERFTAPEIGEPYVLFLHSASWRTKLWPTEHWRVLARLADEAGYAACLAWHSDGERARAEEIGEGLGNARAIHIDLATIGGIVANAAAVISVESGFAHLAAALGRPTVTLYGPTGQVRHGMTGPAAVGLSGTMECSPCYGRRCALLRGGDGMSPCMDQIGPADAWQAVAGLIAATGSALPRTTHAAPA